MKKYLIYIIIILGFSCKNSNDKGSEKVVQESIQKVKKPISEAPVPMVSRWTRNNITIIEDLPYKGAESILLTRNDKSKPAFSSFENVQIFNGSTYKFSVQVKKGQDSTAFGMRVQSKYPNRVDVVYDLDEGKVIAANIIGEEFAENISAEILPIDEDWYLCTFSVDIYENNVRVIFGPTSKLIKPEIWEVKTEQNNSVYLIPSSLKIQEF